MTQTTSERMALIRQAAKKFQTSKTRENRFVKSERKPAKKAKSFLDNSAFSQDERHYTDASKYAQQYYGETYHETTRFDNDWD